MLCCGINSRDSVALYSMELESFPSPKKTNCTTTIILWYDCSIKISKKSEGSKDAANEQRQPSHHKKQPLHVEEGVGGVPVQSGDDLCHVALGLRVVDVLYRVLYAVFV